MAAITPPDWASLPMSVTARAVYESSFLPLYRELQKDVNNTPLIVLVWGPGPSSGDLYLKRLQIRGELRKLGHTALFSEEIDADEPAPYFSSKMREFLQAKGADFIVVLQASPGSTAEVHDFAEFVLELGRKMLIFIDESAVHGYSYTGALQEMNMLYKNVETYSYPKDITDCNLLSAVKNKIKILQWAKFRSRIR